MIDARSRFFSTLRRLDWITTTAVVSCSAGEVEHRHSNRFGVRSRTAVVTGRCGHPRFSSRFFRFLKEYRECPSLHDVMGCDGKKHDKYSQPPLHLFPSLSLPDFVSCPNQSVSNVSNPVQSTKTVASNSTHTINQNSRQISDIIVGLVGECGWECLQALCVLNFQIRAPRHIR